MTQQGRKVLTGLMHGGHAFVDGAPGAAERVAAGGLALSEVSQEPGLAGMSAGDALAAVGATRFDYLFPDLETDPTAHLPADDAATVDRTVAALNALGDAMIEQAPPAAPRNAPIPPVHTYWGQFVDHDLTAATDNDSVDELSIRPEHLPPVAPQDVRAKLVNARHPALTLDSVYGDGPFAPPPPPPRVAVPYQAGDPAKLQLGVLSPAPLAVGVRIPPVDDVQRDLPRVDRAPQIGDERNDENLVVAQLHVAFLRFHNAAVDWVRANEPERTGVRAVFHRARDLTRWTYQWLTVHDHLRTVCRPGTVDAVLEGEGDLLDLAGRGTYIPIEFSVAAFRFGHSMIRGAYDWNRNFGRPGNAFRPVATLDDLFRFTGKGGFVGGATTLPSNWPVEWDRLVDADSLFPDRFARPIDTHLAGPLQDMENQLAGTSGLDDRLKGLLKHLARRNLLRGYRLSLPTGQAVATALGFVPISGKALLDGGFGSAPVDPAVRTVLEDSGLHERTPLWYYVLRESEITEAGNALGPVGSAVVAATIIGQIRHDPTSYLNQPGWTPAAGVRLPDGGAVTSIAAFLRFAGVL